MVALDAVHQLHRVALRRNQVEPAPRDHHGLGKTQDVIGNGIAMMMIVEQPRLLPAIAQSSLNFGKVHAVVHCK